LLSVLIHGPKRPSIDIDIFLEPLMQEMETLWKEGIDIIDDFTRQPFNLRVIIFVTSIITRHCLSYQDKSKVGRDARCAWMASYHLSWKVLER
jgi:putative N-acetylmannosamine-6-phosphate epimerase